MSFLISYMRDKERISSLDIEEQKGGDELEENEQDDTEYEVSVEQISPPPDSHRKRELSKSVSISTPKKKCNRSSRPQETASATVMKYLLENRQQTTDKDKEKDSLELFFESMVKTVKTFSPVDQHLIRNQIYNLVSQMEAKYLMPHPPSPQSHFHSTNLGGPSAGSEFTCRKSENVAELPTTITHFSGILY